MTSRVTVRLCCLKEAVKSTIYDDYINIKSEGSTDRVAFILDASMQDFAPLGSKIRHEVTYESVRAEIDLCYVGQEWTACD